MHVVPLNRFLKWQVNTVSNCSSSLCRCTVLSLALLSSISSLPTSANAQIRLEEKESEAVTVTVRTIEASNPISQDGAPAAEVQTVDTELADLRSKLHEIPYQNFRLVASKQERLCLKKKQSLQLPNGQSLSFRPLYMDGKKVGLWINWKDHDGAGILDTRLHFNSDDSVITGTDQSPGIGTVLAIKAEPIVKKSDFMLR